MLELGQFKRTNIEPTCAVNEIFKSAQQLTIVRERFVPVSTLDLARMALDNAPHIRKLSEDLNLDPDRLRYELDSQIVHGGSAHEGTEKTYVDDIPFTEQARWAVISAINIAESKMAPRLSSNFLILGVLDIPRNPVSTLLESHGVSISKARFVFGDPILMSSEV